MALWRRAPLILLLLVALIALATVPVARATSVHAADVEDLSLDDDTADMAAFGDMPDGDEDEEVDMGDEDEDEEGGEGPDAVPPSADMPAVIDPEGEENATGYTPPSAVGAAFFDDFQTGLGKWQHTGADDYFGEFKTGQGAQPTFKGDRALIIPHKARKYGLSTKVVGMDNLEGKDVVMQYELKLDQGMTCGGGYVKLPTSPFDPATFDGSTKYSVMFGPDKCGATDKVHFIFQTKNPLTGAYTEHHMKEPPSVANTYDKKTHLYTLVVKADGKFQVFVDNEVKKEGTLLDNFNPPVQPEKEVDDPDDKKPEDWVDEAKIADPEATKPEDWDEDAPKEILDEDAVKPEGWLDDEPLQISDPDAKKPDEWDDGEDGDWEAPLVANPKCEEAGCGEWTRPKKANPDYKGKWKAPMIDNPKYLGVWKPRKIANKEYYDASKVHLLPISGLGFEIWTMDHGVLFDNVWLGSSPDAAKAFAKETFVEKQKTELAREEERNKKSEDEAKKNKKALPVEGKLGVIIEKMEDAIDKLDGALQPVEKWLVEKGAEPYLDRMLDMGIQKPMIVVTLFPLGVVLLFSILLGCGKKKVTTPEQVATEVAAQKKRTDEPTPDDAVDSVASSVVADVEPEKQTVRKRRVATAE